VWGWTPGRQERAIDDVCKGTGVYFVHLLDVSLLGEVFVLYDAECVDPEIALSE